MVSVYCLNDRLGNIYYYDSQGRESFQKPYSEQTARVIDEEVSKLIESQYQRAIQILTENKEQLTQLAEKLLSAEVIFKEDLEEIFGKRPWDREHIQEDLRKVEIPEELKQELEENEARTVAASSDVEETENNEPTEENKEDSETKSE
jgi:hypothetical protein